MRRNHRFYAGLACLIAAAALALYTKETGSMVVPSGLAVVGIALVATAHRESSERRPRLLIFAIGLIIAAIAIMIFAPARFADGLLGLGIGLLVGAYWRR